MPGRPHRGRRAARIRGAATYFAVANPAVCPHLRVDAEVGAWVTMMPDFTGEVTLGSILTIVTLIGVAVRIGMKFGRIEARQDEHTAVVTSLAASAAAHETQDNKRFDTVTEQISELTRNVYTLVGAAQHNRGM